ncbi:MAG: IS701 family transposase [Ktedonobacteraceae bacterium]
MKPSEHSTSEPLGATLHLISCWVTILHLVHQRLAPLFARPEVHQHALLYLQALLSDIPRKNGWQIAEQARLAYPYGIQRLLSHAVWDQDAVRDLLRGLICQALHSPLATSSAVFPVLAVDESGFPKRGRYSAGVAPQYCGVSGIVENCQVGVFLSYITEQGHGLIDRELYLPEDWCSNLPRRQAAHIPDALAFATKPELAIRMLQRARQAHLPARWVVGDTVYGHSSHLRDWLTEHGYSYALAVPCTDVICVQTRKGLLLADVASIARGALRPGDWHQFSVSSGTKGERLFDWARLPLLHAGVHDGRSWLLVRRCLDNPAELAYILVWAPPETSLFTMAQAYGARWSIEEDLQASKALGLDQYEVRSYQGWYRPITLVLLAYAFLLSCCLLAVPPVEGPQASPSPALIALTVSEVQHLLAHLLLPAPSSVPLIVAWSLFRRSHQYWAGYYHRRRRQKAS